MRFTPTNEFKEADDGRDLTRLVGGLLASTGDRRILRRYRIDLTLLVEPEFTDLSDKEGRS